ncbi:unnamed protein product [Wuchereria bancrofti]|uniref:Uncharacterized protein n=1 Tax=Wuchereria bancrofti TaxID=6293 RepID=A0A3P7DJ61_WUCBA|nr:unnamed protein product [Wuchereria bancrofti]
MSFYRLHYKTIPLLLSIALIFTAHFTAKPLKKWLKVLDEMLREGQSTSFYVSLLPLLNFEWFRTAIWCGTLT